MRESNKDRVFKLMGIEPPKLNEDVNDGAFNDAGEPRMTHQQYRDYSEPSEPDYDEMDRDMPDFPQQDTQSDFRDIDWKMVHEILVQSTQMGKQGKPSDMVTVNDLTDYDGFMTQADLDLLDAANLVYVDGQIVVIDDPQYMDYQKFLTKAKEVWQNPNPYLMRAYTRGGDDSEAPYLRGYEPMDEELDEEQLMKEIFGWSQKEKDAKALQQKIEQAKQEVEKGRPGATAFGQPATEGKWSEPRYHKELMQVRLNLMKQEMPTVAELLPDLFQPQGFTNAIFDSNGNKIQGYVLQYWYPIVVDNDGLVRINSGKEKLIKMLDQLTGNLNEGNELFPIGSKVRVSDGSGVDSNKIGTVVSPREIKTDGRSVPINVQGAYKPVDWSREVAVRLSDGELITMFKNRLTQV